MVVVEAAVDAVAVNRTSCSVIIASARLELLSPLKRLRTDLTIDLVSGEYQNVNSSRADTRFCLVPPTLTLLRQPACSTFTAQNVPAGTVTCSQPTTFASNSSRPLPAPLFVGYSKEYDHRSGGLNGK